MLTMMLTPLPAALGESWNWTEDAPKHTWTATRDGAVYEIDASSLRSCTAEDARAIAEALNRAVDEDLVGRVALTITRKGETSSAVAALAGDPLAEAVVPKRAGRR